MPQESLYIVMEYCPGGDLAVLLENFGYFAERDARRYIAETVRMRPLQLSSMS